MKNFLFNAFSRILFFVLVLSESKATAKGVDIIPYPTLVEKQEGSFALLASTRLYYDKQCQNEANYLQQLLINNHGLKLALRENTGTNIVAQNIYLLIQPTSENLGKEGYTLKVDPKTVVITGMTPAGVFYGIQSLRQIIQKKQGNNNIPCQAITDKPRFGWRAFLLDEGRYFKGAKVVKGLPDEMALLKLNTFHWHLTDDQGWRIEIKKYPRVTEVGSTRTS